MAKEWINQAKLLGCTPASDVGSSHILIGDCPSCEASHAFAVNVHAEDDCFAMCIRCSKPMRSLEDLAAWLRNIKPKISKPYVRNGVMLLDCPFCRLPNLAKASKCEFCNRKIVLPDTKKLDRAFANL